MTALTAVRLTLAGFASVMRGTTQLIRSPVALPPLDSPEWQSSLRAFAWGMRSVGSTVLALVLFATYIGIGALAHDTHFSLAWALASTVLVWAGPAQIILISTLGSGATVVQAAIAVTVSAIRLFPMVVSVLPMMRTPQTKRRHLILVAHFIAVTLWVECFRFLPQVPRERRIAFIHGLGSGLVCIGLMATTVGYSLAANLSQLFAAAILLLTPLAFLFSTARNCRELADVVALVLGLVLYPVASMMQQRRRYSRQRRGGGHHRLWRSPMAGARMSDFIGDWHALLVLLVAGVLPNQIWRMLGLWFGGGIDEGSELLVWVRAVATAVLAGVIAQIVVQPPGALASVPDWLRYAAVAAGFAAFMRRGGRFSPAWSAARSSCWPANGGSADWSAPVACADAGASNVGLRSDVMRPGNSLD